MDLRKTADHPSLIRHLYTDNKLSEMTRIYCAEPKHLECLPIFLLEDMQVMSDYELHSLCCVEKCLKPFMLDEKVICDCGKMKYLDELLPKLLKNVV